jgi:DNA primase
MMAARPRYSEFVDMIDVDSFEEAIGFAPERHDKGNDIGYCPDPWGLHKNGDTTGKFAIHRDKRVYNCFVCGGGSLLSLAMAVNDMAVEEAVKWIYQFTHGEQKDDEQFSNYLLEMLKDTEKRVATLPYFNEHSLDRFEEGPRDWFYERGIDDEVIDNHRLIFVEKLYKGAPRRNNGDKIDSDYVGPAAIFPHRWNGQLVGWQNRWIDFGTTPKWLGKWTNTSEFPKHETIFNYDAALTRVSKMREPIVVQESVATTCFLETCGVLSVSTFGAEVSDAQLRLLRRFQLGVVLCPDNDPHGAGENAVRAVARYLERFIPVYYVPPVTLKPGADLGDYASTDNPYDNVMEHLELASETFSSGL